MDFIVKDLDSTYKLDTFHNKTDKIIFEMSSEHQLLNVLIVEKHLTEFILDIKERYKIFPYKGRKLFCLF